jgi:hypothetical protein
LLNFMTRPDTKVQRDNVPVPGNPAVPAVPVGQEVHPNDAPGTVHDLLWDQDIDRLLAERNLAAERANDELPSGPQAYWAASILACAAYQANYRIAHRRPSIRRNAKKSRSFPDA